MISDEDIAGLINQPTLKQRAAAALARKREAEAAIEEDQKYQLLLDVKAFLISELGIAEADVESAEYKFTPVKNSTKATMRVNFAVAGLEFYGQHLDQQIMKMTSQQFSDSVQVYETELQMYVAAGRGWRTFKDLATLGEVLEG